MYSPSSLGALVIIRATNDTQSRTVSGTNIPCLHSMAKTATARIALMVPASPILSPAISEPTWRTVNRNSSSNSETAVKPPNWDMNRIANSGSHHPSDHSCRAPESRTEAESSDTPRNRAARLTPVSPSLTFTTTIRTQETARYDPRGKGSSSIILPGSRTSLATSSVLTVSSTISSRSTQLQGSRTVTPASEGDSLRTASTAVPTCIEPSSASSSAPPSPPPAVDSTGTSMTSRARTTTAPSHSTLSVTLS